MKTSRARSVLALTLAAAVLGVSACGDDTGHSSGSGGGGSSPEDAYAAFVQAVADDDADAFDAAVHDGYWSDLGGVQDDDAANLAIHHWQVENGVLELPDEPSEVLEGEAMLGDDATGDIDDYAKLVGDALGMDDLTGDDLATVTVSEGYATYLANAADEAGCVEDGTPIEECLDEETDESDRADLDMILVRGDDGWQVFGTEYD